MPSYERTSVAVSGIPENRPHASYRANIDFVSPAAQRAQLAERGQCFLGVSLENSNFTPGKLAAMLRWIARRFSRCTVLVGDSIHRITLASTRSLSEDEALSQALALGDRFIADTRALFAAERAQTEFTFLRCSEVQQWDSYARHHRSLIDYHRADRNFRESVETFGRRYHGRYSDELTEADLERRIERSSQYFLEESAVFACLAQQGLSVMVYPGSFSTLSEITGGRHPGAPQELRRLTVVSLGLRRR
ncbi:tRNA-dependent cyclodipeptide synthase [Kitasatospora kifunensis]|uniref:Cyclodipeptide synthase n=1 Tax=Kitasatospora kifunensis TaxID=58351 RepID=A0A7W7W0K7_KITKI|nr:tRNA-dependent cyclodipeptide synthase [Kitasatospora kifunensis]MBB4928755.1 tRNA-dependent cyclodipeptide synthase [Kitasatospora kifunensis]